MNYEATLQFLNAPNTDSRQEAIELTDFDEFDHSLAASKSTISSSDSNNSTEDGTPSKIAKRVVNSRAIEPQNIPKTQNVLLADSTLDSASISHVSKQKPTSNWIIRLVNIVKSTRYTSWQIVSRFLVLFPVTVFFPISVIIKRRSLILMRPYFEIEYVLLILALIAGPAKQSDLVIPMLLMFLIGGILSLYIELPYIFFVGWLVGKVLKLVGEIFDVNIV